MPPAMALSSGPCIGQCIYCGARRYSRHNDQPLGREHVVPRGLGGQWTVLRASCKCCENTINSESENICQSRDMLGPLRYRLGLKQSALAHLPIKISFDGYYFCEMRVPADQAPIMLGMPVLAEPLILRRIFKFDKTIIQVDKKEDPDRNPYIFPTSPPDEDMPAFFLRAEPNKILHLMKETGAVQVQPFPVTILAEPLLRMVAKIAHSFAVYQMRGLVFKPFLQNLILGRRSANPITEYVGGYPTAAMEMPVIADQRHHLELIFGHPGIYRDRLLIVNMWLFRDIGFPPFRVVVGRYRKERAPKLVG